MRGRRLLCGSSGRPGAVIPTPSRCGQDSASTPTARPRPPGGLEPAIAAGRVHDFDDVIAFIRGRLETVGPLGAAFAAAACQAAATSDGARLEELDTALDARTLSPATRTTSRQLGRQLPRTAATLRPDPRFVLLGKQPQQPLALAVVCAVFDLTPSDAALPVLRETVTGVAAAAVRLLRLDAVAAYAVSASLSGRLDELAATAGARSEDDAADLPAPAVPLLDLFAEQHTGRTTRLFAS